MSTPTGRAVVVGAGSAGLATAAALRGLHMPVTVLEAGSSAGARWHERYGSLRLNTVRSLSGLPGLPIPHEAGNWVGGTTFARYLAEYARHHRLDVRTGVRATRVDRAGDGWLVRTDTGTFPAGVVVVATGHADRPHWPRWPGGRSFAGAVLHSGRYRRPEPFTGHRVLVVGSGNSATEIATELATRADTVWLSVRRPPLLVPTRQMGVATQRVSVLGARLPDRVWDAASLASHRIRYANLAPRGLPVPRTGSHTRFRRDLTPPVAERGFAAAVRQGRITVVPATADLGDDGAVLADGQHLYPDVVIAATGYRPNFAELIGHLPVLDGRGLPVAWAEPLPAAPGLFVVGAPSLQGDIREHGREARRVAAAVAGFASGGPEPAISQPGGRQGR